MSSIDDYIERDKIQKSRDYKHLKDLLDAGKEVIVSIQILPYGYRKYDCIAKKGIDNERKFYTVGYGNVYTDDVFFRKCQALDLEFMDDNENTVSDDDNTQTGAGGGGNGGTTGGELEG